ncbi:MAG: NAD(P)H-dependent oxidoreductase [Planctomycetota bacterium]
MIVYAHPKPSSFNHAILDLAVDTLTGAGDSVVVSDLYGESFSPTLAATELDPRAEAPADVLREQQRLAQADSLLFLYPIWWFDRPAVLKGWCDRVLRPGFAYAQDAATGAPVGLLAGKKASIVVTFGAAEGQCKLDHVVFSMAGGTLGFCGIHDVGTLPLYSVPTASREIRTGMLEEVRRFLLSRRPSDRLAESA